jgi:hypothetical protein
MRSRRFRTLPSDAHRLLFLYLVLSADPFGNLEGDAENVSAILRRDLTDEECAAQLAPLIAADLIRPYDVDGKAHLHIPRYRQRLKYDAGKLPRPPHNIEDPWITNYLENKGVEKKDRAHPATSQPAGSNKAVSDRPRSDVEVKRSDVKRSDVDAREEPVDKSQQNAMELIKALGEKMSGKGQGNPDHAERVRRQANAVIDMTPEAVQTTPHSNGAAKPAPAVSQSVDPDWSKSEKGIAHRGQQLGIDAVPGETWAMWRDRIYAADRAAKRAKA